MQRYTDKTIESQGMKQGDSIPWKVFGLKNAGHIGAEKWVRGKKQ